MPVSRVGQTVPVDHPSAAPGTHPGLHLLRGADRVDEVDALAERLGGRVGLAGVLGDLDRRARTVRVPAPAAVYGFRWDREDMRSPRWWPQGITTSADSFSGEPSPDRSTVGPCW